MFRELSERGQINCFIALWPIPPRHSAEKYAESVTTTIGYISYYKSGPMHSTLPMMFYQWPTKGIDRLAFDVIDWIVDQDVRKRKGLTRRQAVIDRDCIAAGYENFVKEVTSTVDPRQLHVLNAKREGHPVVAHSWNIRAPPGTFLERHGHFREPRIPGTFKNQVLTRFSAKKLPYMKAMRLIMICSHICF